MSKAIENNQFVIFRLENEDYGLPINFVETIERVSEITRVPNAPYYIIGVLNLRGEVVPVIDLRKRFSLGGKEIGDETRIIILSLEEMVVGILVDGSSEVLTIENDMIDHTTSLVNTFDDDYINGIGKVNERMIIIVDVYKMLGVAEIEN
ncbi:chemotaxis protein CheW [Alkaliphilus hydrothermalis]|uniref:Purine-binding chemotaxis protein CheW n=1 Tax=Alkaliphilus hydrothermalis TaxID=1482730 RepID=A0ABS2NLG2_9FIRM|nr:chemotaxis protein CheW [Alkaliphilus hydrothermalis]MBM7613682.1 purine-binding chemotaxis protein CheW [Alkaliphilus hydrothermalis]